jgi:gluconokinase
MFIIVMGVSGSGKTTIARMLAQRLGWRFYEGDTFHPPANIAKMSAGVPLSDDDRLGWLDALANLIENENRVGENGVIACSALKKAYRDVLRKHDRKQIKFVYLRGSYDVIFERMKSRGKHFMKPEMLQSQFAILEEPQGNITVDVTLSPDEIVQNIMEQLMRGAINSWSD